MLLVIFNWFMTFTMCFIGYSFYSVRHFQLVYDMTHVFY